MGKNTKIQWDVIVVGAGAAGMMAAITAARNGRKVIILEKTDKAGKKLLATGNGKCNFTNAIMKPECYGGDRQFTQGVLAAFGVSDALDFFHSIGIYPKEKNGYYYPNSEQAASVVLALTEELYRLGVTIVYRTEITQIQSGKYHVTVTTPSETFHARKLILAVGLKAAPKLGSDGSLFPLIKELGHRFAPVLPALCGFYCKGIDFKRVSGVRAQATVTACKNGIAVAQDTGELQFTEYGLSGIPVFQISRFLSQGLYEKAQMEIIINLLPQFDKDMLLSELKFRKDDLHCKKMHWLNGLIPQKLADWMLNCSKDLQAETLADWLLNLKVTVTGYRDFEFAQVCTGGIPTEELDAATLESIYASNVHFAGEIINVDGICGGYNLHFAWATGFIAGNAASKAANP